MKKDDAHIPERDSGNVSNSRREFLRKSVYAAYATPLITALLVEKAGAADSLCTDAARAKCEKNGYSSRFCRDHCLGF